MPSTSGNTDPDPTAPQTGKRRSRPAQPPPSPRHRTERSAAVALWTRREKAYRSHRPSGVPELPAVDELIALISHVAAHPNVLQDPEQRGADTLDAVALITHLRRRLDEWETKLVRNAHRPGARTITLREYAAAAGLKSAQAADARFLRLLSAAADGAAAQDSHRKPVRREEIGRLARTRPAREAAWLTQNARDVRAVATALIQSAPAFEEDERDDLDDLAEALAEDPGPGPVGTELASRLIGFAGKFSYDFLQRPATEAADTALSRAQELRASHWHTVDPKPKTRKGEKDAGSPAAG
jgi:hypothetical protein